MPRMIAEGVPTEGQVIIKELRVIETVRVNEKEVVIKGANMLSGTINFNNTKKSIVTFVVPFTKVPRVSLTMNNTSVSNPYISSATPNGFTVNFQNNWTGMVEWMAIERE